MAKFLQMLQRNSSIKQKKQCEGKLYICAAGNNIPHPTMPNTMNDYSRLLRKLLQ
jgi:hypothetical protein